MRFVKPLDRDLIVQIARSHELIITVEENVVRGGAGSAVNELLHDEGICISALNLGIPDKHVEQGSPAEMLALCGLDPTGIHAAIAKCITTELATKVGTA